MERFIHLYILNLCHSQTNIIGKNIINQNQISRFLLIIDTYYDYSYIFNNYLDIYFPFFIKNKKLIYQDKIFPRKIELLKYLSTFVFDSQKCKEVIDIYMKKNGLVFKRIKIRFNKWTN